MRVIEFLDKVGVKYKITKHKSTFTAQHMAAEEHEPGRFVAKLVIVKADDKYVMCVLAAPYKVDLSALKGQLGAKTAKLVDAPGWGDVKDRGPMWEATTAICLLQAGADIISDAPSKGRSHR